MCAMNLITVVRKAVLTKAAGLVIAGAGLVGFAAPASAGHGPDVDVRILPETDRVWVPPVYEDREVRYWVEPVYETVIDKVWVPPVYRTECERIWIPPVCETVHERVWVPPVYRDRVVEYRDHRGRRCTKVERVLVEHSRWETHRRQREVRPGRWEMRERQVLVCEGHYKDLTRQVLVREGHFATRLERVCVREGYWKDCRTGRHALDVRIDGFQARVPLDRYRR